VGAALAANIPFFPQTAARISSGWCAVTTSKELKGVCGSGFQPRFQAVEERFAAKAAPTNRDRSHERGPLPRPNTGLECLQGFSGAGVVDRAGIQIGEYAENGIDVSLNNLADVRRQQLTVGRYDHREWHADELDS
jgi:hypothetical protein